MTKKLILIAIVAAAVKYSGIRVRDIEDGFAYVSHISAQIMTGRS